MGLAGVYTPVVTPFVNEKRKSYKKIVGNKPRITSANGFGSAVHNVSRRRRQKHRFT